MLILRTAALFLLALAGAAAVCAQDEPVALKMATTDVGLLVTVDVNGKPVVMFIDTGASFTHLDARFLDLPRSSRSLRIHGVAGGADFRVLERVTLTLADSGGAGRAFDIQTLDVDLATRRKWCKCELAGVLGLDVLRRFASFTIDFEAGVLRLRQPAPGPVADLRWSRSRPPAPKLTYKDRRKLCQSATKNQQLTSLLVADFSSFEQQSQETAYPIFRP
ncbi:MAG: hypothetical protein ACRD5G_15750 [Candidatus Acidiferrales bacterium]